MKSKTKKGRYITCINRRESKYNYEGCPYNVAGRPMNTLMDQYYNRKEESK